MKRPRITDEISTQVDILVNSESGLLKSQVPMQQSSSQYILGIVDSGCRKIRDLKRV